MRIYPINDLPSVIHLGKQTEMGVREVRLDCACWKALWPALDISVWVTPPGGEAAYPAVTHMEGDVLVWPINDSDTAVSGDGYMEVMGVAEGLKKLSAIATTRVLSTTTAVTAEPPEPAQSWVNQVLEAAERAESAGVQTVNGKEPDDNGDVTLEASDVHALPDTGGTVNGSLYLGDRTSGNMRTFGIRKKLDDDRYIEFSISAVGESFQIKASEFVRNAATGGFMATPNVVTFDADKMSFAKPIAFGSANAKDGTLANLGAVAKNQGAENAGKLMYVGTDGTLIPLALGAGLEIRDGVLVVTNAQTVSAICGEALCGEVKCGEV